MGGVWLRLGDCCAIYFSKKKIKRDIQESIIDVLPLEII